MGKILWAPPKERRINSNLHKYQTFLKYQYGLDFKNYGELYNWSINKRADFWSTIWEFSNLIFSRKYDSVLENGEDMLNSKWFRGAQFNFAENLLRHHNEERTALISIRERGKTEILSYKELYKQVASCAEALKKAGIGKDDRVAAFMPNINESVVCMLSTVSFGAIWSSCSPDLGLNSLFERFRQIKPKILFMADGYFFNGKIIDLGNKIREIAENLPSVQKIVVFSYVNSNFQIENVPKAIRYKDFLIKDNTPKLEYEKLPFDHPVYILYTSGTTGKPKCIVHGAGGTLLQHFKEIFLHTDVKPNEKIYYATTCGWVLWNWLVSSLFVGATVILRDGSLFFPSSDSLFELIEKYKINHFGVSARYITSIEKLGIEPKKIFNLNSLRTVMYGGSALSVKGYKFVYRSIKKDVMISSMAGGTDIISCFAIGNPLQEVRAGEIQGWGLGMECSVFDDDGNPITQKKGELVCTKSFPAQPIGFWNDKGKTKYNEAYFKVYPNIWRHGDFAEITEDRGVIIDGRSDSTLNPGGVRIGTSEIYQQIDKINEVSDSIAVGQKWNEDERIILFVKLKNGSILNEDLIRKIKKTLRENCGLNHVPAKVISVAEIPYTKNGKKVEIAVRRIINGESLPSLEYLDNPESLDIYKKLSELEH